jgi:hypothetical protein
MYNARMCLYAYIQVIVMHVYIRISVYICRINLNRLFHILIYKHVCTYACITLGRIKARRKVDLEALLTGLKLAVEAVSYCWRSYKEAE